MFHSLKQECGTNIIHQSHKNNIPLTSIQMFTLMANNRDLLAIFPKKATHVIKTKVGNTYILGIKKMKMQLVAHDAKFKQNIMSLSTGNMEPEGEDEEDAHMSEI
jgi:hypothetical protein